MSWCRESELAVNWYLSWFNELISLLFQAIYNDSGFVWKSIIGPRVDNGKRQTQRFNERSTRFSLYEDTRDIPSPSTRDKYNRGRTSVFWCLKSLVFLLFDWFCMALVDFIIGYGFEARVFFRMKAGVPLRCQTRVYTCCLHWEK